MHPVENLGWKKEEKIIFNLWKELENQIGVQLTGDLFFSWATGEIVIKLLLLLFF